MVTQQLKSHKWYLSTFTEEDTAEERKGMASGHRRAPQDASCVLCRFSATTSWLHREHLPLNILYLAQNGYSTQERLMPHFNCKNKICPN